MRKKSEIKALVDSFYAELVSAKTNLVGLKAKEVGVITSGAYADAHDVVGAVKNSVEVIIKGTDVDGLFVDGFLSTYKTFEANGKLDYVELTIKSKIKAEFPFKQVSEIKADADFVSVLFDKYIEAVIQLLYIKLGGSNLNELNARIANICKDNGITTSFAFTLQNSNDYIVSIDDSLVVFNASLPQTFELSSLSLFQYGDDYDENVRTSAENDLISQLKAIQNTPQIIKSGINLIKTLTDVKTKKRAERLIRGTYHKQAQYFNTMKSGIGYVDKKVTIKGEEVDIFALLQKNTDGSISVVLQPFNIMTLFTIDSADYDVVADITAELKKAQEEVAVAKAGK